jgi:hypothetical protein
MPFHVLSRDEISDSFGMDSHSKEDVAMVKWRISRCSLRRPCSENVQGEPSFIAYDGQWKNQICRKEGSLLR